MPDFAGLVLAGRREGVDPFAESVGASHRALIPVAGVPMLLRVLRCLAATSRVADLTVSIDRPELIDEVPEIAERTERRVTPCTVQLVRCNAVTCQLQSA